MKAKTTTTTTKRHFEQRIATAAHSINHYPRERRIEYIKWNYLCLCESVREFRFLFVFSCVCVHGVPLARAYYVRAHGEATKMNKVKINVGHRRCQWHRSKTICHRAYLCGVRQGLPIPYPWHFGVKFAVEKSFSPLHCVRAVSPWAHKASSMESELASHLTLDRRQIHPSTGTEPIANTFCAGKSYCGKSRSCVAKQILADVFIPHRAFQTANT